jgi:hypothetical protein
LKRLPDMISNFGNDDLGRAEASDRCLQRNVRGKSAHYNRFRMHSLSHSSLLAIEMVQRGAR